MPNSCTHKQNTQIVVFEIIVSVWVDSYCLILCNAWIMICVYFYCMITCVVLKWKSKKINALSYNYIDKIIFSIIIIENWENTILWHDTNCFILQWFGKNPPQRQFFPVMLLCLTTKMQTFFKALIGCIIPLWFR